MSQNTLGKPQTQQIKKKNGLIQLRKNTRQQKKPYPNKHKHIKNQIKGPT